MDLVGRYKILERIGEGAMADVYRANDPSIGRDLAIKVLKSELRQNQEISTRFLREAKAAGALSHPGIVTIYDVGEVDGYPYIAMELLEGEPLDEVLQRDGKLPLRQALYIGKQLASALDYAHGLGVVHRDIKPSNIMICDRGKTAKILDFGIARVGEADQIRAEVAMLRTQVGQVLGTPRYMSPEQALGLNTDHRSDLFSLGAVLYEMITGKPAFNGGSLATIAIQITRERPANVKTFLASCPSGVQFILDKLLAKEPDRRFTSGAAVAEALQREYRTMSAEKPARSGLLSLQVRLTMVMGAVTAIALAVSVWAVLQRQYLAMERMALTSGTSVASFVADNVALRAVENAALPEPEQDWLPVQAFVTSASKDPNVDDMVVIDAHGVVRGSKNPALIGHRRGPAANGTLVSNDPNGRIVSLGHSAFRFDRKIVYAGGNFGQVELSVDKRELNAAARATRNMLLALALVILLVVMLGSYAVARALARPIRRLKGALTDAAAGRLDFRISHNRSDEFGELFDCFNALAGAVEERTASTRATDTALDATRIGTTTLPPVEPLRKRA